MQRRTTLTREYRLEVTFPEIQTLHLHLRTRWQDDGNPVTATLRIKEAIVTAQALEFPVDLATMDTLIDALTTLRQHLEREIHQGPVTNMAAVPP